MEYTISQSEIDRRVRAFTTLSFSLPITFFITGLLFWRESAGLIWTITLALILVFILFWVFIVRFFRYFRNRKFILTDHFLERITPGLHEKIALSDIKGITIVKTTNKKIREVRIYWKNRITVYDGLGNFAQFVDDLVCKCKDSTENNIINEPIDYDHPLFYVILGFLIGVFSLFSIRAISVLEYTELNILYYLVSAYSGIMGLYFIIGKPLSRRYGRKSYLTDLVWGLLLIFAGIGICFIV